MPLNDTSSLLSHLRSRRSGRPREMTGPGPSDEQLADILELAARTPDHGKLVPYRFIIIADDQRDALASLYEKALLAGDPAAHEAKIAKSLANAHAAPTLVMLIFSPMLGHKIPVFEQEMTCGAVGMNLLHAAHAHGFVGGWITGWPASDPIIVDAFCQSGEAIAGLFYLGTSGGEMIERDRPDMAEIVSRWTPPGE